MKRSITQALMQWKNRNSRKPLILRGARQVGKTYSLVDFGKTSFPYYHYMLMHLTKVYPFCTIAACEGQDFRERCRSFGGNSLPTLPAGSIWRKADGRMDLCVRTVAAGSIG